MHHSLFQGVGILRLSVLVIQQLHKALHVPDKAQRDTLIPTLLNTAIKPYRLEAI